MLTSDSEVVRYEVDSANRSKAIERIKASGISLNEAIFFGRASPSTNALALVLQVIAIA